MPARRLLPTYELYADQLLPLNLGYALYEPDPIPGRDEVRIGDIGYVYDGRFKRIASVFEVGNGNTIALDAQFREIDPFTDLDKGVLSSKSVLNEGFEGSLSGGDPTSGASAGISLKFSCRSERGATLIRKYRATVEKASFPLRLKRHFSEQFRFVYDFAKSNDIVENLQDIVLVTGRVMTGDWATLTFYNHSQDRSASFDIRAATVTAKGTLWGKWSEDVNFPRRHGPPRRTVVADDQEPTLNQCVFIETCRYYDLPWYKRLMTTMRVVQKKGPIPDVGDVGRLSGAVSGSFGVIDSQLNGFSDLEGDGGITDEPDYAHLLTAYDALALQAFCISGSIFDFICIDEEDIKRQLPTSGPLNLILGNIEKTRSMSGYSVVRSDVDPNVKEGIALLGKLRHDDEVCDSPELFDTSDIHHENKMSTGGKLDKALRSTLEWNSIDRSWGSQRQTATHGLASSVDLTGPDGLDSTSSLPGPGRTLALLFEAAGSKSERIINKSPHRATPDPRAVGRYIRELRRGHEGTGVNVVHAGGQITSSEDRKLKKMCRKLLKYSRSHLLKTQSEALEEITILATTNYYVRQAMATCLHQSYLIPPYVDEILTVGSSAPINTKEYEVHCVWSHFYHHTSMPAYSEVNHEGKVLKSLRSIGRLMRDPDASTLMARYMTMGELNLEHPGVRIVWTNYLHLTCSNPQIIEWDLIEAFIKQLSPDSNDYLILCWMSFFFVRPVAIRVSELLLRKIFRPPKLQEDGSLNFCDTEPNLHVSWRFLFDLFRSRDLEDQVEFLRHGFNLEYALKDTILGNEMYIVYIHMHHSFTKSDPLMLHGLAMDDSTVTRLSAINHIIDLSDLANARAIVAQYLKSKRSKEERIISTLMILRAMCFNRYTKMAFLPLFLSDLCLAVATSSPTGSVSTLRPGKAQHRSRLEDCEFVDLASWDFVYVHRSPQGSKQTRRKVTLYYFEDALTWIEILGVDNPFDVTGHFPIRAAANSSGEERYIGMVIEAGQIHLAYVSDCARWVTYVDRNGNVRTASHFYVLVLRYNPMDMRPPYPQIPADATHPTGPIYWKYGEEVNNENEEISTDPGFRIVECLGEV